MFAQYIVLLLGLICAVGLSSSALKMSREGHLHVQRPRLGHFKTEPYTDLYKIYAVVNVLPNHRRERVGDDNRNYAPAGEECMVYLGEFQRNNYEIQEMDEHILLDACLGYLYESPFHEEDREANELINDSLDVFINDAQLKAIYDGTHVDKTEYFSTKAQDCIGDTLWGAAKLKRQYPDVVCNNHWLQLFIDFAECHHTLPSDARQGEGVGDVYAKMIYDFVKTRGTKCFEAEITHINKATLTAYANNPFYRVETKIKGRFSIFSLQKQADQRMWPKEITELLSAVQGTGTEINIREVHNILKGTMENKGKFEISFFKNMAEAATKRIVGKKQDVTDASGSKRYQNWIDRMCNYFRSSDDESWYDYATAITRMIKMLDHRDVFDLNADTFMDRILNRSRESGAIYLSVYSCNVLTYTEAKFKTSDQGNAKQVYRVFFRPNTSGMLRWPIAKFY